MVSTISAGNTNPMWENGNRLHLPCPRCNNKLKCTIEFKVTLKSTDLLEDVDKVLMTLC